MKKYIVLLGLLFLTLTINGCTTGFATDNQNVKNTPTENIGCEIKGDLNNDGIANQLDSIIVEAYIQKKISLTSSQKICADISEDGFITTKDVSLMKNN